MSECFFSAVHRSGSGKTGVHRVEEALVSE